MVYGGKMSMVFLVTCMFPLLEGLKDAFEVQGLIRASLLHPITDNDSMQGHAAQIFLTWKR